MFDDNFLKRFYEKVKVLGNGCHEWQSTFAGKGYGTISLNGKKVYAHRVALEIKQPGFWGSGLFACHTCDNAKCCNPDHLFAGTQSENLRDMVSKGRDLPSREATNIANKGNTRSQGEKSPRAKLTQSQVQDILRLLEAGHTFRKVARVFNVSHGLVGGIASGRNWGWLTGRGQHGFHQ